MRIALQFKHLNVMEGSIFRGLKELGHEVFEFKYGEPYDLVLLFNVSAHNLSYSWEDINQLENYKFAFIDMAEYGWWTHYDKYASQYYSSFAPVAIKTKPETHTKLLTFLKDKSYPYFLREMYKVVNYPKNYHPIDYTLNTQGITNKTSTSLEEFKGRYFDIFFGMGDSHPVRTDLANILKTLPYKKHVFCGTTLKLPQAAYFKYIEGSKLSISYDGFGSGSFRETEVLSRTALFRNKMCVRRPNPLTDGVNFVEYTTQELSEGEELQTGLLLTTNLPELISKWLSDINGLYEIYINGYNHCMTYYTEKAMSQYILDVVQNHDWDVVTSEKVEITQVVI